MIVSTAVATRQRILTVDDVAFNRIFVEAVLTGAAYRLAPTPTILASTSERKVARKSMSWTTAAPPPVAAVAAAAIIPTTLSRRSSKTIGVAGLADGCRRLETSCLSDGAFDGDLESVPTRKRRALATIAALTAAGTEPARSAAHG